MACPLADTADCCTPVSADAKIRVDHLLEQIWICGEEGKPAQSELLRVEGPAGQLPIVARSLLRACSRVWRICASSNSMETETAAAPNGNNSSANGVEVQLTEDAHAARAM